MKNHSFRPIRNAQGATLGLVLGCAFILAVLVFAFFQYGLNFGGGQEMRNAVDAGALNIGKEIYNLTNPLAKDAESQFEDVMDSKGNVGLTNINRVWAKALLINLNQATMESDGTATSASADHADAIYKAAESISDKLTEKLSDQKNLHPLFDDMAARNSAKMLGDKAVVNAREDKEGWTQSCMERGSVSNISFEEGTLPGGASKLISKEDSNKKYLAGYVPMTIRNHDFHFVPFKANETPHLVSTTLFEASTTKNQKMSDWKNPVPNAFAAVGQIVVPNADGKLQSLQANEQEAKGQAKDPNDKNIKPQGQSARACVLTNPQRTFKLSIPHGFVRIVLKKNTVRYRVNGIPRTEADSEYGFTPGESKMNTFNDGVGVGVVNVSATLGLEYVPPTLFKAIYALPGNHDAVTTVLLQRCREINPDFTAAQLESCLNACPIVPNTNEYLLIPIGDDKFGKVEIIAVPQGSARGKANWLKADAKADGKEKQIVSEFIGPIPAPAPAPNTIVVTLAGPGAPIYLPSFVTELGVEKWTPGTGFDQCLGELEIERETQIDANGFTQPVI